MTQTAKMTWSGRLLSVLAALPFVPSAAMKLVGHPEVAKGMLHLGLPEGISVTLGLIEVGCVAFFAIPQTAVLGAILLTGYLGGAILTHWRIGEPVWLQVALGIFLWLGLWLREPRLRAMIPIRTR